MKKYSRSFWVVFVLVSVLFLATLFVTLEIKNKGLFGFLKGSAGVIPVKEETSEDLKTLLTLADAFSDTHGETKTFLILFQNNMELRPGGGFIGSFGILKVKDGHAESLQVHDVINFDGRIPDTVPAPYPMKETLGVKSLKFRDSNYHPDFALNAKSTPNFFARSTL